MSYMRVKVFKKGPSKICGRQPLKILAGYGFLIYPYKVVIANLDYFY